MVDLNKVQVLLSMACPHDPEEITPEKRLVNDLDLDSFGLMEMVMAFEREFGIEIPDRDLRMFDTVGDVVAYLEQRQGGFSVARAH